VEAVCLLASDTVGAFTLGPNRPGPGPDVGVSVGLRAGTWPPRTIRDMNSSIPLPGGTANDDLVKLLAGYGSFPAIAEGLAIVAGCEPHRLSDPSHPVLGYLIDAGEIFTAWMATPTGFNVFELARGGDSLTVTVPWTRVARVVVATENASTTLSVEIAADRTVLGGEFREGAVTASLRPAGYVLTATDDADRRALVTFSTLLRRLVR
jgi:hypothetical protein